jgi:Zn-dependent M16 (insulinase) family peptidase
VNSYIVVPTECRSDNGLPHTLEHLVFLGSEDLPYKGVLDKVAFRNLASGTNAYTDVHHTAYTMTTAGSEGTLALLPVFLDHVLYPNITSSGFVTEVYHVDGKGAEAGVVFSEMQAIENESRSVAYLALRKLLYPGDVACWHASSSIRCHAHLYRLLFVFGHEWGHVRARARAHACMH